MYMFWEKFIELCKQANVSPSGVAREIGLSNSAAVKWKKGAIPDSNTLQKIADYFDVSVDYLLGKGPTPSEVGEALDFNTVIIRGRDGNVVTKKLSNEQIKVLEAIIDQFPDAPDDL